MTVDPDLAEIIGSLRDRWFPGLARKLAEREWIRLQAFGIDPETYSTSAMAAGNPSEAGRLLSTIVPMGGFGADAAIRVEFFREGLPARYADLGMVMLPFDQSDPVRTTAEIEAGLAVLDLVPDAAHAVGGLVRSLHPIVTSGPEFDISYSDPDLPFTIFLGVHGSEVRFSRLRSAEGILHEAMHLQLTLMEGVVCLYAGEGETSFSPWQGRQRPVRGVLHGLYVFRTIQDLMVRLSEDSRLSETERRYCSERVIKIEEEVKEVGDLGRSRDLTDRGRSFAISLLDGTAPPVGYGKP